MTTPLARVLTLSTALVAALLPSAEARAACTYDGDKGAFILCIYGETQTLWDEVFAIQDHTPIAFATIDENGVVENGSSNVSAVWEPYFGHFRVTIEGENIFYRNYTSIVTPTCPGLTASTGSIGGMLVVKLTDASGAPTPCRFGFVTYD